MIGQMRERVLIKAPNRVSRPGAGAITEWSEYTRPFARVDRKTNNYAFQADQKVLYDTLIFTIRYRPNQPITKSMLVEYEGVDYQIDGIDEVNERQRYWRITAQTTGQPPEEIIT